MGKLITFLVVVVGAIALANHVGIAPSVPFSLPGFGGTGVTEDGRSVVFKQTNVETAFTRGSDFEGEFMIFGGMKNGQANSLTHASIAGLPLETARTIASRFPDFTMCRSPGADSAKRFIENMNLIATTTSARDTLSEALDLHNDAIRSGGERACLHIEGASLDVDRVELGGQDRTADIKQFLSKSDLYLVRQASLVDCESALR